MIDPVRVVFGGEAANDALREKLAGTVAIQLADHSDWNQQLLLLALVDLLRRLLSSVEVNGVDDVAAHVDLPPGPATLSERLELVSSYGCPAGDCPEETAAEFVIGAGSDDGWPDGAIHVNGRGWVSYVGRAAGAIALDEGSNPIGALSAACRAAAVVVRKLVEGDDGMPGEGSYWDSLTLAPVSIDAPSRPPAPLQPNVEALLMGCGSIGGAVAYTLARAPGLAGELILLDSETLEDRNQAKAILARPDEIENRREKVDVAAEELDHSGIESLPRRLSLEDFVASRPREQTLPLVLCAVDSIASRRELQDCLPLEVVNAACDGADVFVSGHVTDQGPCVYCLHIEQVLDSEAARINILARETGIPPRAVAQLVDQDVPLNQTHLTAIERHRGLETGALDRYCGQTLEELFESALRYGEQHIDLDDETRVAIPAPYVTALAGILLAAEALKAGQSDLHPYRLGPGALGIRYYEAVGDAGGMLTDPPRYAGGECLCNDPRRLRLLKARYQLDAQA